MSYTTTPVNGAILPDWRSCTVPETANIPPQMGIAGTMLVPDEIRLLYALGRDFYTGEGCIVDAGCFLGGSTRALAQGLRDNPKKPPSAKAIHTFDMFAIEPWTLGIYFPKDTPLDRGFLDIFERNIAGYEDLVQVHVGDVTKEDIPALPKIEILFNDLSKSIDIGDFINRSMFPKLIPGKSVLVQQDYLFGEWTGWLHVAMEEFSDYFELIDYTYVNSVAFHYRKAITPEALERGRVSKMTASYMRALSDRAIARFSGSQRDIVVRSAEQLQEYLASRNWAA